MRALLLLCIALAGCSTRADPSTFFISHGAAPFDGKEWHTCRGGGLCEEGYACVKGGCEWCGGDRTRTRCTEGND